MGEVVRQSQLLDSNAVIGVETNINGAPVGVQNPLPTDGDSVYVKDVDFDNSIFTDWVGETRTLFESPFTTALTNSTTNNPKHLTIALNRTVQAMQVGLGATTGSFSNVKLVLVGSGGTERSIVDNSFDGTKRASLNVKFDSELFNSIRIEFHTADPVSLSNIIILKSKNTLSQIEGVTPRGRVKGVSVTELGELRVAQQLDIFGNLPVADQYSIWDSTRVFPEAVALFWSNLQILGGTNVHNKVTSSNTLAVPAVNGAISATQLKQRQKYQPLKAHKGAYTGVFVPQAGVEKYFGLADLDDWNEPAVNGTIYNGVVYVVKNSTIYAQIYNNGILVEEAAKEDWNIDKLDGFGTSGFNLNLNFAQIGITEMEWLGVGAVLMYFNIGGTNIPVHLFEHANNGFINVYTRTANLSPMYMIKSTGGAGAMTAICNAVVSGGGHNPVGVSRTVRTTTSVAISSNETKGIIFLRLKPSSYEATVNIKQFGGIVTTSSNAYYFLVMNPIINGDALVWQDKPFSHVQYAFGNATNTIVQDSGIEFNTIPVSVDGDAITAASDNKLRLGKELQANALNQTSRYDVICLAVYSFSTNENFVGFIDYEDTF